MLTQHRVYQGREADMLSGYSRAKVVRASDGPIQHDTEAIDKWAERFNHPSLHIRRLHRC